MFKRLFWLVVGILAGSSGSFWLMAKARERVARYRPDRVAADASGAVRGMGRNVRTSLSAGRDAMRSREAELRAELSPSGPGGADAAGGSSADR